MKHFYKCPTVFDPLLIKANDFLPAVALQIRPDGHEGDRMAGAEFPTDRECKESRRAHQRGTINLTLPQTQPGVYFLLTRETADGLEIPRGPHGHWTPDISLGPFAAKSRDRTRFPSQ